MRVILCLSLGFLIVLAGCEVRTNSFVRMMGDVNGKMEGKMRTETAPVVDSGPLLEVPIGPHGVPDCKTPIECKVAVIDVDGLISNQNHTGPSSMGENPLALFKEKLDAAAVDSHVKAVVLRINTPGGGVAATDQMWHELQQFRAACNKPIVACLLDLGCGGGYYLATGCDAITAVPSGVVGGLGVLLNLYEMNQAMGYWNTFDATVRAGDKSDMGSPVRAMKDDVRELLEGMAKSYHERFKDVVVRARPKVKRDAAFFDGRAMTGSQALEAGLVDSLGYLDEAVHLAANLAKTKGAVAVMYRRQGDAARSLYARTPNTPLQATTMQMLTVPGMERSKLPMFLYMWQAEPTFVRLGGI